MYLFIFVLCMSPTPRAFGLHRNACGNFELACFERVARKKRPDLVRKLFCKATVQNDGATVCRGCGPTRRLGCQMNDRPSYRLVPSLGTYELMTIAPAQNVLIGRSAVVPVPPSGQLPTFYVRISDPTISKQHAHLDLSADGTVLSSPMCLPTAPLSMV